MLFETVKVQVRSVVPVSRVTVTLPVEVTASEKVTSMSMTSPTVYEPLVLFEVMVVMVGGVESRGRVVVANTLEVADTLPAKSIARRA